MYLVDYFEKKPRSFIWVIGLLLNLIIGLIDYLTGLIRSAFRFDLMRRPFFVELVILNLSSILSPIIQTIFPADSRIKIFSLSNLEYLLSIK